MDELKTLTNIIKKLPSIEPADDFTQRVMSSVMNLKAGFFQRAWYLLIQPREFTLNPIRALHTGMSNEERTLYFMLVAFAHMVIAVVLSIGSRGIKTDTVISPFLMLQPWISLAMAAWLGFWGFIVKNNSETGSKIARFTTLVYIEIAVINGTLLLIEFNKALLLIPLITVIAGITIATGIFLALICGGNDSRVMTGSSAST